MRICYFADGRSLHTRRWMRYFRDAGHEMHLISFAPVSREQTDALTQIGVRYHGATGNFHLKKFWLTLNDVRFVRSVLKSEKIDILHSHFLGSNAMFAAASGFHPHIITLMGGGDITGPDWKPDSSLQSRIMIPKALRQADHITSWSKLMADVVRPYCRSTTPIDVIHGGVHLEKFFPREKPKFLLERYSFDERDEIIFSPRLLRPLSNIHTIAEAFCRAVASRENPKLLVAAPDHLANQDYRKQVEQILNAANIRERVRFLGELRHEEIADHFCLADVTVSIPSIDGTPMTVLESMACGTPTVIGNLPDYDQEYFENEKTTLMVDINDPNEIADAISRFLTDEELTSRITTEARRRVLETGGYEYQMGKMEKIYESLQRI